MITSHLFYHWNYKSINKKDLAGEEGFGPPNDEVKVRCLTAWLLPYKISRGVISNKLIENNIAACLFILFVYLSRARSCLLSFATIAALCGPRALNRFILASSWFLLNSLFIFVSSYYYNIIFWKNQLIIFNLTFSFYTCENVKYQDTGVILWKYIYRWRKIVDSNYWYHKLV